MNARTPTRKPLTDDQKRLNELRAKTARLEAKCLKALAAIEAGFDQLSAQSRRDAEKARAKVQKSLEAGVEKLTTEFMDRPGRRGPKPKPKPDDTLADYVYHTARQVRSIAEDEEKLLRDLNGPDPIEWDLPRATCPTCGNPKARQEPDLIRIVNGITTEEAVVRCPKCNPLRRK